MDKTQDPFLAVISKERGEISFLFIRKKGQGIVWCHEARGVESREEFIQDFKEKSQGKR